MRTFRYFCSRHGNSFHVVAPPADVPRAKIRKRTGLGQGTDAREQGDRVSICCDAPRPAVLIFGVAAFDGEPTAAHIREIDVGEMLDVFERITTQVVEEYGLNAVPTATRSSRR